MTIPDSHGEPGYPLLRLALVACGPRTVIDIVTAPEP